MVVAEAKLLGAARRRAVVYVERRLGRTDRTRVEEVRAEHAGLDHHALDTEALHLERQRLAHGGHGKLGRIVERSSRITGEAGHGADIDDTARPLRAHRGKHRTSHVHHAEHVRVEYCARFRIGGLLERAEDAVACVVHQHVDTAERVKDALHGIGYCIGVAHVERDRHEAFLFSKRFAHRFGPTSGRSNAATAFEGNLRELASQSSAGTGDHPNRTVEHTALLSSTARRSAYSLSQGAGA